MSTGREHYDPNLPSCTELLKWAGYYDGYPPDHEGFYFKRGNWTHAICGVLAQGAEPNIDETLAAIQRNHPTWDLSDWRGYPRAFRVWLGREQTQFIAAEQYVRNEQEHYQGTYDLLLYRPKRLLVDIKTGSCLKATALQTAGYALCLGVPYPRRLGLELHADGTFTEYEYRDFKDFDAFRLLVRWYHKQRDYR